MTPPPGPRVPAYFTPGQWRLVTLALTLLSAALVMWVLYRVMVLAQLFVATFSMVIWPLAIAAILAALLRPLVRWLETRLRVPRTRAIILIYFVAAALCLAAALVLVPLVFGQLATMVRELPTWIEHSLPEFIEKTMKFVMEQMQRFSWLFGEPTTTADGQLQITKEEFHEYARTAAEWLKSHAHQAPAALGAAKDKIVHVFEWAAVAAVIPIYLFFLLDTEHDFLGEMRQQLTFLRPEVQEDLVFLLEQFMGILNAFFRGQILVGVCLGVIKGAGFTLIGLEFGLVLGLLFGLLNIIPYLGTILGLAVVLPVALFQPGGGWDLVALALAVFAVAQLIEAYLLTPKIMGEKTGLHPMVIILSIFFWGKAFSGILGMVLGVPLTAFFVVAWRLLRVKYLPRLTSGATRAPFPVGDRSPAPPAADG